jgi:hypothetical protein
VSPALVNLAWSASADNIGVAKYHIYRSTAGGSASEVATSTTTSLGNTGLNAATTYNYYVTAEDAAGNVSTKSTTVSATTATQPTTVKATIIGKITGRNGGNLGDARAVIWVNGNRKVYQARYDGTYAIPQLSAGTYRVKYASYNYYPQTSSITVTTGQTVTKNVSLTRR